MSITVREIQEYDLERIMNWRMDPDVTRYMPTNPKLKLENQKKWLENVRSSTTDMKWVVEQDGTPVGIISLGEIDWEKKRCSWGYYIGEKKYRSLNLAISLEMSLYDFVFRVLDFDELTNDVFSLNAGVVKLHLACGNRIESIGEKELEKEGVKYDITHMAIRKEEWLAISMKKKYEKVNFDILFRPHHVGYAVADIQMAMKHYFRLGYYQDSQIVDDLDRNIQIVFMKSYSGDMCVELIQPVKEDSPVSQMVKDMKNVSSPYHICYEVKSMSRAIAVLKKRGYMVTANPAPAVAIGNKRVAFLLNKNVGLIELVALEE